MKNSDKNFTKRLTLINRYFKITKFYDFIKSTAFRGLIIAVIFILVLFLVDAFIFDIGDLLKSIVETCSPFVIFIIFLISESILGLLPPEIFIAWSAKSNQPIFYLLLLSTLSYVGGIISYFIGRVFILLFQLLKII